MDRFALPVFVTVLVFWAVSIVATPMWLGVDIMMGTLAFLGLALVVGLWANAIFDK